MGNRIIDIKKYNDMSKTISFAGTLRNQYKFDLFENVFIMIDGKMVQCKIVGVELPPRDNPDYVYKVELPEDVVYMGWDDDGRIERVSLTCEHIFRSIDDAKNSAYRKLDTTYKINKENIDRFFSQYEELTNRPERP